MQHICRTTDSRTPQQAPWLLSHQPHLRCKHKGQQLASKQATKHCVNSIVNLKERTNKQTKQNKAKQNKTRQNKEAGKTIEAKQWEKHITITLKFSHIHNTVRPSETTANSDIP